MARKAGTQRSAPAQAERLEAPPGEGLRAKNKRDKKDRILEAGRALFSERGFEATTTRDIAERAGIGAGTLFLYFRTKEELLVHLFQAEIERLQAELFRRLKTDAPLVDQLMSVFGGFYDYYAKDPALARTYIREQLFLPPEMAKVHDAVVQDFFRRLTGLLQGAQARGEVAQDAPLPTACINLFCLYVLSVIGFLNAPPEAQPAIRQHLRAGLLLQLRGLAPRKASQESRRRPPKPRSGS